MPKKNYVGIEIAYNKLRLAWVNDGKVRKIAEADMPEMMLKEGRFVSQEAMSELVKNTMKKADIHCANAAFILDEENLYVRNLNMPVMSQTQLDYNLPYEFSDYITSEPEKYYFDYAMVSTKEELEQQPEEGENGDEVARTMSLLAVATPIEYIDEIREMLKHAGLRLAIAAPMISGYSSLIRQMEKSNVNYGEYGIIHLGFDTIRMDMFKNDNYIATRELETGIKGIIEQISSDFGVDVHVAASYLETNYQDCQNSQSCIDVYAGIVTELMRAVNFYRFSNPDSQLRDVWVCGEGALIPALKQEIVAELDLQVHDASEMIPGGDSVERVESMLPAIGIAIDE